MEQQLINSLIRLITKAGGESLVKDLQLQVEENSNFDDWTSDELKKAIGYINWQSDNFGTAEATAIVDTLMHKYNLRHDDFAHHDELPDAPGVKGLQ